MKARRLRGVNCRKGCYARFFTTVKGARRGRGCLIGTESGVTTLAEKLERLFATIHPAGRGPYSNEEVAAAIQEQSGPTISGTYIWLLRKGQRDNPTKKHLEALASFFGVPVAYFFDDDITSQLGPQLDLLAALRDSSVRDIALRIAELSPDSLDAIRGMIEQVRQLEARSNPRSRRSDPS